MPIYTRASGTNYVPAPAGAHAAVCVDVVDLGILTVEYAGKKKEQHKIKIVWQIDEVRGDGKPFSVSKRYTNSLHEKAALRKDLESWRGRPFTQAELEGFDLEQLLGAGALVNVIQTSKEGATYANVTGVMRLPKGMPAPSQRDYTREIDREPKAPEPPTGPHVDWEPTDDDVPFRCRPQRGGRQAQEGKAA